MNIVTTNALLHDIGRLSEIDFSTLQIVDLRAIHGQQHGHALESYNMLISHGITDPNILLPVRYHSPFTYKDTLCKDPAFTSLPIYKQADVIHFIDCIRDADDIANLYARAKLGTKNVGELNDPRYQADYDITMESLDGVINGRGCDISLERHLLDAMLRWLSYADRLTYPFPNIIKIIQRLWDKTLAEAQAQFDACPNKDQARFDATMQKLKNAREIQLARLRNRKS